MKNPIGWISIFIVLTMSSPAQAVSLKWQKIQFEKGRMRLYQWSKINPIEFYYPEPINMEDCAAQLMETAAVLAKTDSLYALMTSQRDRVPDIQHFIWDQRKLTEAPIRITIETLLSAAPSDPELLMISEFVKNQWTWPPEFILFVSSLVTSPSKLERKIGSIILYDRVERHSR